MRDYANFDRYLNSLAHDIYDQPPDEGHTMWASRAIKWGLHDQGFHGTVLDVGCGQGFCNDIFTGLGWGWSGVTRGGDFEIAKAANLPVYNMDMSFLQFEGRSFDMVFARHVLEHSPFPLLTLMEWHRVARKFLLLVAPAPEHWGTRGRNHYMVLPKPHLEWLLERSGWRIEKEKEFTNHEPEYTIFLPDKDRNSALANPPLTVEYRYFCQKMRPVTQ